MTFMPDAHRPKADSEAGCWAGGNFACDASATEPLGLCDRHRAEITSDELRPDPSESCLARDLTELQDQIDQTIHELVAEMEPALRRMVAHIGNMPDGSDATMWIADELSEDEGERVFGWPAPEWRWSPNVLVLSHDNFEEFTDMLDELEDDT